VPDLPIEPNTSHRTKHHLGGVRFRSRRRLLHVLREYGGVWYRSAAAVRSALLLV